MNPFRKQYRQLSQEEAARVAAVKDKAEELYVLLEPMPQNPSFTSGGGAREMALAKTKLEECVMWATKALT